MFGYIGEIGLKGNGKRELGKLAQAGRMLIHPQNACWWQRPQTPLNSPVPWLAARSCGTLYVGPEARQDEGTVSAILLDGLPLFASPVRRSPSDGPHWP